MGSESDVILDPLDAISVSPFYNLILLSFYPYLAMY